MKQGNFFKIQHVASKIFKTGGHNPYFNKVGKLWLLGNLKSHLRQFSNRFRRRTDITLIEYINQEWKINGIKVEDCEVVEYEMVEVSRTPLREFIEKEMK